MVLNESDEKKTQIDVSEQWSTFIMAQLPKESGMICDQVSSDILIVNGIGWKRKEGTV